MPEITIEVGDKVELEKGKNPDSQLLEPTILLSQVMEPPEGILTDFLLRDGKSNTSSVVTEGTKNAKKAVLSYRTLQFWEEKSLVKICLHTGRHHQIRVQMAHAGHPLMGDKKYNPRCGKDYMPVGLCSVQIGFFHPSTGERIEYVIAPKGEAFRLFEEVKSEEYETLR